MASKKSNPSMKDIRNSRSRAKWEGELEKGIASDREKCKELEENIKIEQNPGEKARLVKELAEKRQSLEKAEEYAHKLGGIAVPKGTEQVFQKAKEGKDDHE